MNATPHSGNKGSALLLVLCAVALMSLTVLSLVDLTDLGMSESADKGKDFRARQLAQSGIALGLHPEVGKDDPVLRQQIHSTESFEVKFASEGEKLNINAVVAGQQEKVLDDLFTRWGLKLRDRQTLRDCLMDWVDGDPLKRLHGAEQRDYEARGLKGYPSNRPFEDIDEMELVPGIGALAKVKPDWKDYFTVWNDGKLDLNEATSDLVAAVCEVGTVAAESLVNRRRGPDGQDGTADDSPYEDMAQIRSVLGLSPEALKEVEKRVTLKSDYRRIESTGRVGSYERKLAVVVQLNVTPVQYLTWIEF